MPTTVQSFAKINIGLCIGPAREDGFHALRTVYQTIALHDLVRVSVTKGWGIEIKCKDTRVPDDESNTCWRITERVLKALHTRARVLITIDKQLPIQGGLGAGSSNAVATMFALERELKAAIEPEHRLAIAAEVGSDLPLFLIGGTVLGSGRGEDVWPLQDLPQMDIAIATPDVAISTPKAFGDWDAAAEQAVRGIGRDPNAAKLTHSRASDRMNEFSRSVSGWLTGSLTGVPTKSSRKTAGKQEKDGDRAETLLLDLVRAGIENDFERVVFSQHPELREVKRVLERTGARYASLSGSGSSFYGLYSSRMAAEAGAATLESEGIRARATRTVTREEYRESLFV